MLFDGCDRLAFAPVSSNTIQLAVLRLNDLVEIVREPLLILSQFGEVLYCLLKAADLTRNVGVLKQFCAFRGFRTKLLCGEHWGSPSARLRADAVMSVIGVDNSTWVRSSPIAKTIVCLLGVAALFAALPPFGAADVFQTDSCLPLWLPAARWAYLPP